MNWPNFLTFPRAPDFVIGSQRDPYLRRWWVIPRNKWFNIYLHQFCRSDDDRALHDHPWWNISILLRGSYLEHMDKGPTPYIPRHRGSGAIVLRRAETLHRVELLGGRKVWTLFITGPRVREWGFACPQGWRHWKDFTVVTENGNEVGPGCE